MVSFSQLQRKNNLQVLPQVCAVSSDAIYMLILQHYIALSPD